MNLVLNWKKTFEGLRDTRTWNVSPVDHHKPQMRIQSRGSLADFQSWKDRLVLTMTTIECICIQVRLIATVLKLE